MLLDPKEDYRIFHGDCIPHQMEAMPPACVDFACFSPPFPQVYAYGSSEEDIGNSEDLSGEAPIHLSYFFRGLARVLKPGRVAICHVMQIPRMKRSGGQGTHDFRGMCIRLGERAGLIFEYDWAVLKNPQMQAIRTHAHELQFQGMESDRARCRGSMPDYLLKFCAKGSNAIPIDSEDQVSRNDWISWAEGAWSWREIRNTDTLNTKEAKSDSDVRHIAALQLGVINRLVRLYSNPGEIVYSPFCGIGSELYEAAKLGRRGYGCELKDEYVATAHKNMRKILKAKKESARTLFDAIEDTANEELEECPI